MGSFFRWNKNNIQQVQNVLLSFTRKESNNLDAPSHKVNNLEKKFLVWTGKYKSVAEVPTFVTQSVMERTRNRMRIKIANYMMLATVVGCFVMIYLGKQDAKKGETLIKQNLEWHAQQKSK